MYRCQRGRAGASLRVHFYEAALILHGCGKFLFSIASGSLQRVLISAENNRKYYKDCEEIRVEEIRNDIYARESAETGP